MRRRSPTGPNAGGYRLTRADILMNMNFGLTANYAVRVRSDAAGRPGRSLGTLTNPPNVNALSVLLQYRAPGDGIDLEPRTTYWLEFEYLGSGRNPLRPAQCELSRRGCGRGGRVEHYGRKPACT